MVKNFAKISLCMFLAVCMLSIAMPVQAKVSAQDAEKLKNELTPFGAEKAANADGTIPAWQPLTGIPAGITFDPKAGVRHPDPYAGDKVLYTITAQNLDQYKAKIAPGVIELFKRYPETFKIEVYPTHRPAAAPQKVYDNTYQNALTATLIGDGSEGIENAFGGIPFPIPQNGAEAILNHNLRYAGFGFVDFAGSWLVNPNGSRTTGGAAQYTYLANFYTAESREKFDGLTSGVLIEYFEPARRKGEIILSIDRLEYKTADRAAWQYMPGQRRVRRAPSIAYDTPNPTYAGLATYDDAYMFNGKIDRFEWKLLGKEELYVPYNNYAIEEAPMDDLCTAHHLNPKYVRWELHRVWAVEGTLKAGKRHCYGKRVMFLDEDSWQVLIADKYDTRGSLWRMSFACTKSMYDVPVYRQRSTHMFDFQTDSYLATQLNQGMPQNTYEKTSPPETFTAENVRKIGKR
jgi:hypothetical protein